MCILKDVIDYYVLVANICFVVKAGAKQHEKDSQESNE